MKFSKKVDDKILKSNAGIVDFDKEYDVVIAGLGTAGAFALITAARLGLRTLGIEQINCMGGTGTAGGITKYYFGNDGGYYEKIDELYKGYMNSVYKNKAEAKKYVLEREAIRLNAEINYESVVIGVYLEGARVKGVKVLKNGCLTNVKCKTVIDCTGDAVVCEMAGCETVMGRESDGVMQPFTAISFLLSDKNVWSVNYDGGYVNPADAESFSESVIKSYSRHCFRLCENRNERMLHMSPLLGIREGRRIVGEKTVTMEDVFNAGSVEQPMIYAYADFDKHGLGYAFEGEFMQDWSVACNLGAVNASIPIPLGALVPKGYYGIMAAGRCISVDTDSLSCARMVRDMQKEGEAAATAAWLAIKHSCELKDVPYDELVSELKKTGCYKVENNKGFYFDSLHGLPNGKAFEKIEWHEDAEKIKEGLTGETPGVSIWSAKKLGLRMKPLLIEWMKSENENLKKHSAITCGLLGCSEALPVLREMILQRDYFVLKDCRKNNKSRGYIAVYLAGKLGDIEIADELIKIISPDEINKPYYHMPGAVSITKFEETFNELYFQFFTFSLTALIRIGRKHNEVMPKISDAIYKSLDSGFIKRITGAKEGSYEYALVSDVERMIKLRINNI